MSGTQDEGAAMIAQFVLGRSGSGKTHTCVAGVREVLEREGEAGRRLILLAPEQATFQLQQALLSGEGLGGTHRAIVGSFARLAQMVLVGTRAGGMEVLTETAKKLLLRRVVQERRGELKVFGRGAGQAGFAGELSAMVRELRQYGKLPSDVRTMAGAVAVYPSEGGELAGKLADLAVVYEGYEEAIAGRYLDPEDRLDLLAREVGKSEVMKGAWLWIDGFAGFTAQQYRVLEAMFELAERAWISMCLDPWSEAFGRAEAAGSEWGRQVDPTHLFFRGYDTYRRLKGLAIKAGAAVVEPIRLGRQHERNAVEKRFEGCEVLGRLEAGFEEALEADGQPAGVEEGEGSLPTRGIVVVEAGTRREEVEAAARHLVRLCREGGVRWRDMAVILRDFGPYQELLEASFSDHGIPYFLDQRRPLRRHPLVELLRCGLAVLGGTFDSQDVAGYLKTDLTGLERETVDALENRALARGATGADWLKEEVWKDTRNRGQDARDTQEDLRAARSAAMGTLETVGREYFWPAGEQRQAREMTAGLMRLLEEVKAAEQLQAWAQADKSAGRLEEAAVHEQVWEAVIGLFEDMEAVLGDVAMTGAEYAEVAAGALGQMTLGLVPPALDQVLVGTIERSRHPKVRAALVMGFNQGQFPQVRGAGGLLTEEQRERLVEAGFELAPSARQELLQERYLAYIALTRASEFLWVSYAAGDAGGKTLNPSGLLGAVYAGAGNAELVRVRMHEQPELERAATVERLTAELAGALGEVEEGETVEEAFGWLVRWAREKWPGRVDRGLRGVTYVNEAKLGHAMVERLAAVVGDGATSSVSRLECFAACPFQHFARYVLGLEERARLRLEAVDLGKYYHAMLERMFVRLKKEGRGWSDVGAEEREALVAGAAREVEQAKEGEVVALMAAAERNRFLIETAQVRLVGLVGRLGAMEAAGGFRQVRAEARFGFGGEWEALEAMTKDGRRLRLRGLIDRIDVCPTDGRKGLMVMDYKLGGKNMLDWAGLYHGLDLQLLSYALAVEEAWEGDKDRGQNARDTEIAAALYVPIVAAGETKKELWSGQEPEEAAAVKARGLLSEEWLEALDAGAAKSSRFYGFGYKKGGELSATASRDVVSGEEFAGLMGWTRGRLGELAKGVLDGEIGVRPYRLGKESPCAWCAFRAVCRFDYSMEEYRHLATVGKGEVLEAVRGGRL